MTKHKTKMKVFLKPLNKIEPYSKYRIYALPKQPNVIPRVQVLYYTDIHWNNQDICILWIYLDEKVDYAGSRFQLQHFKILLLQYKG